MYEILEGAIPYYEFVSNQEVVKKVLKGLTLDKPTKIPPSDQLWNIMQSCWLQHDDQRPSFQEIYQQLSSLIDLQTEFNSPTSYRYDHLSFLAF